MKGKVVEVGPPSQPPMAPRRPEILPGLPASCPMVCAVVKSKAGPTFKPLPVRDIKLSVDCHIAMAFVTVKLLITVAEAAPAVLFMPKDHSATVTNISVVNLVRDMVFATLIIPNDDASRFAPKSGAGAKVGSMPDLDTNNPELFSLYMGNLQARDELEISITLFEPLRFDAGIYKLTVPTTLPQVLLPAAATVNEIMEINVNIRTASKGDVRFYVPHHPVTAVRSPGRAKIVADANQEWDNVDFEVGYHVWGETIQATLIEQPPASPPAAKAAKNSSPEAPHGNFALMLSPPAPEGATPFCRSVVFLVDRSGSMTGRPLEYAKQAIITGIGLLCAGDEFNIIAYDHEPLSWAPSGLRPVTPEAQAEAVAWVEASITARGLTDILTPLRQALDSLEGAVGIPSVFLITDGAVDNERDICQYMLQVTAAPPKKDGSHPRVSTFAIGPYCNHFFLKQLALLARGHFDVAFRPHAIQLQMERMLLAAQKPVLMNVSLQMPGLTSCELYPFPIPDLFCGCPLVVSGRYTGDFPTSIVATGGQPDGDVWHETVEVTHNEGIPLDMVFVKQRLDLLTAKAWLSDIPADVEEVVRLSVASCIPSAHTAMVGFICSKAKHEDMKVAVKAGRKVSPAALAVGGAAGVAVIGGAAAALAFGNVGATLSGLPVSDVLMSGSVLSGAGDFFGNVGGGIGDAAGGVGDCCGNAGESIGDCLSGMLSCL